MLSWTRRWDAREVQHLILLGSFQVAEVHLLDVASQEQEWNSEMPFAIEVGDDDCGPPGLPVHVEVFASIS